MYNYKPNIDEYLLWYSYNVTFENTMGEKLISFTLQRK